MFTSSSHSEPTEHPGNLYSRNWRRRILASPVEPIPMYQMTSSTSSTVAVQTQLDWCQTQQNKSKLDICASLAKEISVDIISTAEAIHLYWLPWKMLRQRWFHNYCMAFRFRLGLLSETLHVPNPNFYTKSWDCQNVFPMQLSTFKFSGNQGDTWDI